MSNLAQRLASESYFGNNMLENAQWWVVAIIQPYHLRSLTNLNKKSLVFSHSSGVTWYSLKILGRPVPMPLTILQEEKRRMPITTISDTESDSHYVSIIYVCKLLTCNYTYHCNHIIACDRAKVVTSLHHFKFNIFAICCRFCIRSISCDHFYSHRTSIVIMWAMLCFYLSFIFAFFYALTVW